MPRLQHTSPTGESTVHELHNDGMILGRMKHEEPHIVLAGNGVSRRHAAVTHDGQRWYLEDLNSRNQTIVNKW